MDALFEQRIIQNTGFATELIHLVVSDVYRINEERAGLPFPLVFLILPLLFHKRTVESLKNKKRTGAIFKAIEENREIPVGLQKRMESCYEQTLEACSLGFSSKLFAFDSDTAEIVPTRTHKLSIAHVLPEVKDIIAATKRVSQTFCDLTTEEISRTLEVVF